MLAAGDGQNWPADLLGLQSPHEARSEKDDRAKRHLHQRRQNLQQLHGKVHAAVLAATGFGLPRVHFHRQANAVAHQLVQRGQNTDVDCGNPLWQWAGIAAGENWSAALRHSARDHPAVAGRGDAAHLRGRIHANQLEEQAGPREGQADHHAGVELNLKPGEENQHFQSQNYRLQQGDSNPDLSRIAFDYKSWISEPGRFYEYRWSR